MVGSNSEMTWRQLWFDHLNTYSLDMERLRPGRMFVERNDELEVDISAGQIEMEIQSGPRMVYNVSLRAPKATSQTWQLFDKNIEVNPTLLDAVSRGTLPVEAGLYAQAEAIGLLPSWNKFSAECSCPAQEMCKHISALLYFLGDHFDHDPFELMRFFGRSREQFLASITSSTTSSEYRPESAEQAWFGEQATLPQRPAVPHERGDLATWPTDPPQNAPFDATGLHHLGDEALERAWKSIRSTADSNLSLGLEADLARRASEQPKISGVLAQNAGLTVNTLSEHSRLWEQFGEDGVLAYAKPTFVVDEDSETQFRQAPSGRWYRFERRHEDWHLTAGPIDPALISTDRASLPPTDDQP